MLGKMVVVEAARDPGGGTAAAAGMSGTTAVVEAPRDPGAGRAAGGGGKFVAETVMGLGGATGVSEGRIEAGMCAAGGTTDAGDTPPRTLFSPGLGSHPGGRGVGRG
eukprot:Hpha_TRINITY_DN611_c0_g2::TRINITY_DN611_c0_g2_i1::g.21198::m.21198